MVDHSTGGAIAPLVATRAHDVQRHNHGLNDVVMMTFLAAIPGVTGPPTIPRDSPCGSDDDPTGRGG